MNYKRDGKGKFVKGYSDKRKHCPICSKKLSYNLKAKMCGHCAAKERIRKYPLPPRPNRTGAIPWNKGKGKLFPKCLDCGKLLKNKYAKRCIKCSFLKRRGINHHNWRGGISRDKHSPSEPKYKQWRSDVFQRDNWTCQTCNKKSQSGESIYLEAHHIKSWAKYPALRYDINNGMTLCNECKKLTYNYKGKNND